MFILGVREGVKEGRSKRGREERGSEEMSEGEREREEEIFTFYCWYLQTNALDQKALFKFNHTTVIMY